MLSPRVACFRIWVVLAMWGKSLGRRHWGVRSQLSDTGQSLEQGGGTERGSSHQWCNSSECLLLAGR